MNETLAHRPRSDVRLSGQKRGAKYRVRDILIMHLVALAVSFLIKAYVLRPFYIPSASMDHTLQVGDTVPVNELAPSLLPVGRGDIVVFKDPGGWVPRKEQGAQNPVEAGISWLGSLFLSGHSAPDENDHVIKRVIGVAGDHVACCTVSGQVTINGSPIYEPYVLLPEGTTTVSESPFDVVVPPGALWVMGDNCYKSADSHAHRNDPDKGFVHLSNVVGRAFALSWPPWHWTWLDNYPDVFRGVDRNRSASGLPAVVTPH